MNNTSIEDILIDHNSNDKKKNKGKSLKIILVVLLILVILLGIAYMFFSKPKVTNKELISQNLNNVNVLDSINDDKLVSLMNNIKSNDTEIESNIQYSTSIEKNKIEDIDFSRFNVNLNNKRMLEANKDYTELSISYLGNEILRPIKILRDNDKYAIAQDEIVNMYVGYGKDDVIKNINNTKYLSKLNKIVEYLKLESANINSEDKQALKANCIKMLVDNAKEENVQVQDNFVLDNGINVVEYSLILNQEEYKQSMINILNNIKNNDELLNKFVIKSKNKIKLDSTKNDQNIVDDKNEIEKNNNEVSNEVENENINVEEKNEIQTIKPNINSSEENIEENTEETRVVPVNPLETQAETIQGDTERLNAEQMVLEAKPITDVNNSVGNEEDEVVEENKEDTELVPELDVNENIDINNTTKPIDNKNIIPKEEFLYKFILSKKMAASVEDIKASIDEIIEEVSSSEGKGIILKIYTSQDGIEKFNIVLPNGSYFDFIFNPKIKEQQNMKITYIHNGDNNIFKSNLQDVDIISADENEFDVNDIEVNKDNQENSGFSIEIIRNETDSLSDSKFIYAIIENQEINKKLTLESKLNGNVNSKKIKSNISLSMSTSDGESKLLVDGNIYIRKIDYIEDITEDNTLFINSLPQPEIEETNQAIKDKIKLVYDEKQNQFNFIDTNIQKNNGSFNVVDASQKISKEDAKKLIEEAIDEKRKAAEEQEEEFTLENLKDLTVEGYEVKVKTNDNKAVVTIDVYTFNIDNEFNVIDIE